MTDPARIEELVKIKNRILGYCAKQERCTLEVRKKLEDYGATDGMASDIMKFLLDEHFVDDQRYAGIYVRSKFNQHHWGRLKLKNGLYLKGIKGSEDIIRTEISQDQFDTTILHLVEKKMRGKSMTRALKASILRYLGSKGYPAPEVWSVLNKHFKDL